MNLIWPTLQPRDVRKEIGKEKKYFGNYILKPIVKFKIQTNKTTKQQ